MFVEYLINFEIFILTNRVFLKIQYFPSQKSIFNTSENNIIIVKASKVEVAQHFFVVNFHHLSNFFQNIILC
jgi:hypothetical protein